MEKAVKEKGNLESCAEDKDQPWNLHLPHLKNPREEV